MGREGLDRQDGQDRIALMKRLAIAFLAMGALALAIVNTDSQHPRVERIEVFLVPRELAQLARTIASPIPAIEKQEHALAA